MTGKAEPSARWIAQRAAIAAGAELVVAQATGGAVSGAGVLAILGEGFWERHRNKAAQFVGAIAKQVGDDVLRATLEEDPERDALLWAALDAVVRSGVEQKRILLAKVVANAVTSDEPIDEAHMIVAALSELDAPHIRALVRLRDADDANQASPSTSGDEILDAALERELSPVVAGLLRSGVVYQGSVVREDGLASIPNPRTYGITGVSDFGRRLLADLEGLAEHHERLATD